MARSLIISSTDTTTGKVQNTSVTNINPNAPDSKLIALAQGLNNLTTNTYVGATKVDKIELSAENTFHLQGTPVGGTAAIDALTVNSQTQIEIQPCASLGQVHQELAGTYAIEIHTTDDLFQVAAEVNGNQLSLTPEITDEPGQVVVKFAPDGYSASAALIINVE